MRYVHSSRLFCTYRHTCTSSFSTVMEILITTASWYRPSIGPTCTWKVFEPASIVFEKRPTNQTASLLSVNTRWCWRMLSEWFRYVSDRVTYGITNNYLPLMTNRNERFSVLTLLAETWPRLNTNRRMGKHPHGITTNLLSVCLRPVDLGLKIASHGCFCSYRL